MLYPYTDLKDLTLPSLFDYAIFNYADHKAFGKVGEEAFCYSVFDIEVKKFIKLLQSYDIQKGDKVALLSENMPHWSIAYFGVTYFGAVIVPILPDFTPKDIHNIIEHSEAKGVIVSSKHLETIEQYNTQTLNVVINLDTLDVEEKLTKTTPSELNQEEIKRVEEDDLASILYTSGTTGHSKGVMLSHKNLVSNATSTYNHIDVKSDDVWLSILPLAHVFECTVGMLLPILHGSSIYYVDKVPTPSVLLKAFEVVRPTMMLSVPLIIEKIYKNKVLPNLTGSWLMKNLYAIPFVRKKLNKIAGKKLIETFGGRIRFFGLGGAGTSPYVEKFLIEAEFPFIVGYGLSETAPLISGSTLGERVRYKSCGTAVEGVTIRIKDKDSEGKGEIAVKSPSIMMGYYKDVEKTAEVFDDEGWFLTGDLGYLDEDGYLYISGRSKNVIIGSSGENIYPEQLEATINQKKGVIDSLVIERDSKLVALLHLDYEIIETDDTLALLEDMRKEVNSEVSSFSKMVKFIEEKEPFIKTPTKKIKRYLYTK